MTEKAIMNPEEVKKVAEMLNRMLGELDKILLGHSSFAQAGFEWNHQPGTYTAGRFARCR